MTNVSWRRILQSAGNDYSGEDGALPARRQARPPEPYDSYTSHSKWRQKTMPGELEVPPRHTLDRDDIASKRQQENWDPIFVAQELDDPSIAARQRVRRAPKAKASAKRGSSGARNIIAISLSAAVAGLAVQQIGVQWNQSSDTADNTQQESELGAASLAGSGKTQSRLAEIGYAVQPIAEPQNIAAVEPGQRPSLQSADTTAEVDNSTIGQGNFDAEIAKAAAIFAAREQEAREAAAREQSARRSLTNTAAPPRAVSSAGEDLTDVVPLAADEEKRLLQRGKKLLSDGDVAAARLLFENLAMRESAVGAFALAQTYDPKYLNALPNVGLKPNEALAAKWYGRAVSLGERATQID